MFIKENIQKIEFDKVLGDIKTRKIALFNKTKVSTYEVNKSIHLDEFGENPYVILITEEQFNNVFESEEPTENR